MMLKLISKIINPNFLQKIDRHFLLNYPKLWILKLHRICYHTLIINLLLVSIIFVSIVFIYLIKLPPISNLIPYILIPIIFIGIFIYCLEYFIYWFFGQFCYSIEKQFGNIDPIKGWLEILSYMACIFLIISQLMILPFWEMLIHQFLSIPVFFLPFYDNYYLLWSYYTWLFLVIIYCPLFLFILIHFRKGDFALLFSYIFWGLFFMWSIPITNEFLFNQQQSHSSHLYLIGLLVFSSVMISFIFLFNRATIDVYVSEDQLQIKLFSLTILPLFVIILTYGALLSICLFLFKNFLHTYFECQSNFEILNCIVYRLASLSYLPLIPYLKSEFIKCLSCPRD